MPHAHSRPRGSGDTRWITGTVALLAIVVFAISGSQILPDILAPSSDAQPLSRNHLIAFILNIALVLLAWRRSEQLRRTFAERDAAEQLAYQLAYYDEVTGLLNRRRLNELLAGFRTGDTGHHALLLIDLDHFKRINDQQGHAAGDYVLQVTARRIEETCPAEAACVRLGGDEFAILISGAAAEVPAAEMLAARLVDALNQPIEIGDITMGVAASIGVSLASEPVVNSSQLLERADLAMYEAKRGGRNRVVLFDREMEAAFQQRKRFEAEMREGIASGQFVPFFQPIVDLASGEVSGFEVLARWNHPLRGLIEPPEFLDLADRIGAISDLSFAVMHEALGIARAWPAHLKISVNISPAQFKDPLLAQRILKVLSVTGFPAARLELEIMERILLDDLDQALAVITSLKNSGVGVSVDDFGTGYASLAQLRSLPFDRIKIDRRFIASLLDDRHNDALVRAIATLGKGLKMPITAEGVETEPLRLKLVELGCSDAQGWVFSRALSAADVTLGFGDTWESEGTSAPIPGKTELRRAAKRG